MLNQEQYEQFISFLPKNISNSLKEIFREKANVIQLLKGKTLIDENPTNPKVYFILKGSCVRFIITPTGDEKAIMFHTEDFIPIVGNMHINSNNSIVNYHIKANEQTTAIEFNTEFGLAWLKKDEALASFILQNSLKYLSTINQLQNHLVGLTSEHFFQWIMQTYPFIFQRFLSKDIASFMSVTPVYLSNLKSKQLKNNFIS